MDTENSSNWPPNSSCWIWVCWNTHFNYYIFACPMSMHFFRNRKKHVTGGALISSDGSAEKIAGPGCTRAAFALAPLAHHRAIVALLSDAHQLVQHLHPHQQVHQRRWCSGTMRQSMMHIMQMHQSQILLDASHIKRALGFMHHNILCIHAAVFQDKLNQVKQKISKSNTKWTIIDHSSFFSNEY